MARLFNNAESLYVDVAPVTEVPFTLACWFYASQTTSRDSLIWIGDKDSTSQWWSLEVDGGLSGVVTAGTRNEKAQTTTGYSLNTWHHAAGVFNSESSRDAYIDGGSKGSNTASDTPSGPDRLGVGFAGDSTPSTYFEGRIAEVGIWNVALSLAELQSLAKGFSPLFVRPESLVAYYPLIGRTSPEIDLVGGSNLTVSGATVTEHPRVYYPSGSFYYPFAAGAAPSTSVKDIIGMGFIPFAR